MIAWPVLPTEASLERTSCWDMTSRSSDLRVSTAEPRVSSTFSTFLWPLPWWNFWVQGFFQKFCVGLDGQSFSYANQVFKVILRIRTWNRGWTTLCLPTFAPSRLLKKFYKLLKNITCGSIWGRRGGFSWNIVTWPPPMIKNKPIK